MAEVTYVQRRRFRWEQAEIELIRYTLTGATADIVVGFKAEYVLTPPIHDPFYKKKKKKTKIY